MQGEVKLQIFKRTGYRELSGEVANGSGYGQPFTAEIDEIPDADREYLVGKYVRFVDQSGNAQLVLIESASEFNIDIDKLYAYNTISTLDLGDGGYWYLEDALLPYTLDLYPLEIISQTYQFTDIASFQALGSFTKDFRIPYTDRNAEVIGPYYDPNYVGSGNVFDEKYEATISVDGIPIASGVLRINSVIINKDGWNDLNVFFYGDTPQIYKDIADMKLKDIVALPTLNHVVNADNINTINTAPDNYIYTLIEAGERWNQVVNNGDGTFYTGPRFRLSSSGTSIQDEDICQLRPAVKWSWILKEIFNGAGYTLVAPSLLSILDSYYCPWLGPKGKLINTDDGFFRQALINADGTGAYRIVPTGITYTGATLVPNTGNPPPVPAFNTLLDPSGGCGNGTYTVSVAGRYVLGMWYDIEHNGGGEQWFMTYRIFRAAGGNENVSFGSVFLENGGTNTVLNGYFIAPERTLYVGDVLQWEIRATNGAAGDIGFLKGTLGGVLNYDNGTGWEVRSVQPLSTDYDRDMTWDAPDILQSDFISDVIKMHNCVIVPDRTQKKVIYMEPLTTYLGSDGQDDWTLKLDTSKDIMLSSAADYQRREHEFTHKAGQDRGSKIYTNVGRVYGNYKIDGYPINGEGDISQFVQGTNKVQLVTESNPCSVPLEGIAVNLIQFPIPVYTNDTFQYTPPGLRCLFICDTKYVTVNQSPPSSDIIDLPVPILSHYSTMYPSVTDTDLNWAPEVPLYLVDAQPYNNLFTMYWKNYLDGLYSGRNRIMTAFFALDLTDILDFSFAKYYWIKNAYWRILKISDYKIGQTESTQVTFIKVTNQANDCNLTYVGNNTDGSVRWEDSEGNPVDGTFVCCSRYGWFWSDIKEKCFANIVVDTPDGDIVAFIDQSGNQGVSVVRGDVVSTASTLDNAVVVGNQIKMDADFQYGSVIGYNHQLDTDKFLIGTEVNGYNSLVKNIGRHFAGGKRDSSSSQGVMQCGDLLLYNASVFSFNGQSIIVFMNQGQHITLPTKTSWIIQVSTMVTDNDGFWVMSQYDGMIYHDGSAAQVGFLKGSIHKSNPAGQFELRPDIDVVTNTDEHRVYIELVDILGTYSYPTPPCNVIVQIKYTQTR
jgi:hypothetical protein